MKVYRRLCHMKNKGVRQLHALPQNSEAIDVRKVAHHPSSRQMVVCDDYPFQNIIDFFLLQLDVWTIIQLILKEASEGF